MFIFDKFLENILDSRLIDQFERRISAAANQNGTENGKEDPHKRGPKPKHLKGKEQKKVKRVKRSSEEDEGQEEEEKKEKEKEKEEENKKKTPAFLMQTASGRTPKVIN